MRFKLDDEELFDCETGLSGEQFASLVGVVVLKQKEDAVEIVGGR